MSAREYQRPKGFRTVDGRRGYGHLDEQEQLDLLKPPLARRTDPATSHLAAKIAEPKAGTNRALALETLRANPAGLTDYELAELTGKQQNSIGKRRGELVEGGFVEAAGYTRKAPSGAQAMVWRAKRLER